MCTYANSHCRRKGSEGKVACFSKGHWACGSAILVPILPIRGWWQLFSFRAAVPKGKGTQYTKCMIKLSIQGAHRFRANQHTMSQCSIVRLSLESQQQRKTFGFFRFDPPNPCRGPRWKHLHPLLLDLPDPRREPQSRAACAFPPCRLRKQNLKKMQNYRSTFL